MESNLRALCSKVRDLIETGNVKDAKNLITDAMKENPDSGVPHNLLGILEEYRGNHILAMKHFRAAWALEPTLLPARWNMNEYGEWKKVHHCAYTEEDVPEETGQPMYKTVYDEKGIGHMVRR